jgi:tetratricopeptide (TPR) repeat protein
MRLPLPLVLASLLAAAPLAGQTAVPSVADRVRAGDAASDRLDLPAAVREYEAALALDSMDYVANWKAAYALVDLGAKTPDSLPDPERDRMYARAEALARRATTVNPKGADGWFMLANATGRTALTKSRKERVKSANAIYDHATTALGLDHRHDGAYHVLGRWNAEIMRLSSFERLAAKSFMGGKRFGMASWDEAQKYMERAVALRPDFIYHRLDLAAVYADRRKFAEAREQLEKIPSLPRLNANDTLYVRQAAELSKRVATALASK